MAYVKIGKIIAVHGLKGELLCRHDFGKKTSLKGLEAIFTEDKNKAFIPWFIEATRIKSDTEIFIKLESVDSRETAIPLAQKELWLPEELFKKFAARSAPANLLGYTIVQKEGPLGEILEVIEQPHQLLCRIEIKGQEVLIPLHEETLQSIDHRRKQVLVSLPEGLLEIYLG